MADFKPMKHLKIPKVKGLTLADALRAQKEFNSRFYNSRTLSLRQREDWTQKLTLAMFDELSELLMQINWKYWKKTRRQVDSLELKFELTDIFTFLLSLMELWGMNEDEILQFYFAKNRENIDRQKRKY